MPGSDVEDGVEAFKVNVRDRNSLACVVFGEPLFIITFNVVSAGEILSRTAVCDIFGGSSKGWDNRKMRCRFGGTPPRTALNGTLIPDDAI